MAKLPASAPPIRTEAMFKTESPESVSVTACAALVWPIGDGSEGQRARHRRNVACLGPDACAGESKVVRSCCSSKRR